jgi:hypothetical protein
LSRRRQAVHLRHPDIHQYDIRTVLLVKWQSR